MNSAHRFIVVGKSGVRIYKETVLIKQFLPYYEADRMKLPSFVSIAYNKFTNEIYILDEINITIQVFDSNGVYHHTKEIYESITSPCKMEIISENNLVIVDNFENRFKVYTFMEQNLYNHDYFGCYGLTAGQFVKPNGVTIDGVGNFIICDTGNHRVQVFDQNGNVISVRGRLGDTSKCFYHPIDVTYHYAGLIFIADYDNHRILVYC